MPKRHRSRRGAIHCALFLSRKINRRCFLLPSQQTHQSASEGTLAYQAQFRFRRSSSLISRLLTSIRVACTPSNIHGKSARPERSSCARQPARRWCRDASSRPSGNILVPENEYRTPKRSPPGAPPVDDASCHESPTENRRSTRQFPLRSGRNSKIAAATEATARNPKAENESGKSRRPADHSKQRLDRRREGQLFGASWSDKYSRQLDEVDSMDADVAASAA